MQRKPKIPPEEKIRLVKKYEAGKGSFTSLAREAGVDPASFKQWYWLYKYHGEEGLYTKPYNHKINAEEKLNAVLEYMEGNLSMREIACKYNVGKRNLHNWIKLYNDHEELKTYYGGGIFMSNRSVTPEERLTIVQYCITHNNDYKGTAIKYEVSYQNVYQWVHKYKGMGEAGLSDRRGLRKTVADARTPEEKLLAEKAELERRIKWLEEENAYLKKVKELAKRHSR